MAVCLHQNMTFSSDQKLKSQVSYAFGNDDLFRLLADSEVDIVMKMLGLLRNLLSSRSVKLLCLFTATEECSTLKCYRLFLHLGIRLSSSLH